MDLLSTTLSISGREHPQVFRVKNLQIRYSLEWYRALATELSLISWFSCFFLLYGKLYFPEVAQQ